MKFSMIIAIGVAVAFANTANALTISRLQYRISDQDSQSITQSVFHKYENQSYVLQIYDRERGNNTGENNERYELYFGSPIKSGGEITPYGVVVRAQKWSSYDYIPAVGFEFNFNRMSVVGSWLNAHKVRTFVQLYAKSEQQQFGNVELLHYYQVSKLLGTSVYARGYNIYHERSKDYGGSIFQAFVDLIYPAHRNFDLYLRLNHVSESTPQLGDKGGSTSLGARYNF